mmetsp:Transcript_9440/g.24050  ORF Transcript_9440/g.24050 Transcript_9440/m.24050 type:complete len:314 (-) Transcript_9440:1600-2541(-)
MPSSSLLPLPLRGSLDIGSDMRLLRSGYWLSYSSKGSGSTWVKEAAGKMTSSLTSESWNTLATLVGMATMVRVVVVKPLEIPFPTLLSRPGKPLGVLLFVGCSAAPPSSSCCCCCCSFPRGATICSATGNNACSSTGKGSCSNTGGVPCTLPNAARERSAAITSACESPGVAGIASGVALAAAVAAPCSPSFSACSCCSGSCSCCCCSCCSAGPPSGTVSGRSTVMGLPASSPDSSASVSWPAVTRGWLICSCTVPGSCCCCCCWGWDRGEGSVSGTDDASAAASASGAAAAGGAAAAAGDVGAAGAAGASGC